MIGGAGYRSRYLSHAKRALYHLSYAPDIKYYQFQIYIGLNNTTSEGCVRETKAFHLSVQVNVDQFQLYMLLYMYEYIMN